MSLFKKPKYYDELETITKNHVESFVADENLNILDDPNNINCITVISLKDNKEQVVAILTSGESVCLSEPAERGKGLYLGTLFAYMSSNYDREVFVSLFNGKHYINSYNFKSFYFQKEDKRLEVFATFNNEAEPICVSKIIAGEKTIKDYVEFYQSIEETINRWNEASNPEK